MLGRRKLRGSGGSMWSVDMVRALLQAARRLLGRVVAPAIVVALAMPRLRHVGELLGERALAALQAAVGHPEAGSGRLEVAVAGEALEVRRQRPRRHRQEAGEHLGR